MTCRDFSATEGQGQAPLTTLAVGVGRVGAGRGARAAQLAAVFNPRVVVAGGGPDI